MGSSRRLFAKPTMLASLLPISAAMGQSAYPAIPVPLDDSSEIALATSAAPREIAAKAAVFTLRAGVPRRIRPGTNGFACMVSRDLHPGSSYPICFDAEGVRTRMQRELMQIRLRMQGLAESAVAKRVEAATKDGTLKMPQVMTVAYMMSPQQVIYSSPNPNGVRVGAWYPHLMIMAPGLSTSTIGLPLNTDLPALGVDADDGAPELVVKARTWSDGTPVGSSATATSVSAPAQPPAR